MGRPGNSPGESDMCADDHKVLKEDDYRWMRAVFAGYQPEGCLISEARVCPGCRSMVTRPVAFVKALAAVLDYLSRDAARRSPAPSAENRNGGEESAEGTECSVYLKSAVLLSGWARKIIPAWVGQAFGPPELPPMPPMAAACSASCTKRWCSWRQRRCQPRLYDGLRCGRVGTGKSAPVLGSSGK